VVIPIGQCREAREQLLCRLRAEVVDLVQAAIRLFFGHFRADVAYTRRCVSAVSQWTGPRRKVTVQQPALLRPRSDVQAELASRWASKLEIVAT